MRVAVLGSFPLDPSRIPGGVEAVIHNLAVSQAMLPDIELHVVTCVRGLGRERSSTYRGMTVHYLPGQDRLGQLTDHFLEQRRLRACVREIRPDIIHAHGTGSYAAAAQNMDFPAVITPHGVRFREVVLEHGLRGWVRRVATVALEKRVLRKAKHVFTIAEYVRQAIAPLTDAACYPVANPVAEKFFSLPTSDEGTTVLSVAAIQPRKGLLDLVEAVARVRKVVPEVRLRLVGKLLIPEYGQRLMARIDELGLQDVVEMVGFVTDVELEREFTTCSVLALCSVEESSPVAIAEAMTLGKPVVASAVGGIPDLVDDGVTGVLTRYGDVEGIANALTSILGGRVLRDSMRAAALKVAEGRFHPAAAAQAAIDVYARILQDTEPDRRHDPVSIPAGSSA